MDANSLAIPIYLDTSFMLDILATIDGGFAFAEKISTQTTLEKGSNVSGSAEGGVGFGIPSIFSLFRVGFKTVGEKSSTEGEGQNVVAEKYHTYGSLLNRLRSELNSKGILKSINSDMEWDNITVGDFVEFRGGVEPNPLIASFDKVRKLIEFGQNLGMESTTAGPTQKGKGKGKGKKQPTELDVVLNMLSAMDEDLRQGMMELFVMKPTALSGKQVLIYLVMEYLRDKTSTELPFGEYCVFGKVVNKIEAGEEVTLMRGAALSGFTKEFLNPLFAVFENAIEQGLDLEKPEPIIEGPACQILPISIHI